MTVGEVISLLTKYASDNYGDPFMSIGICNIDIDDDYITVCPSSGSNDNIIIYVEGR